MIDISQREFRYFDRYLSCIPCYCIYSIGHHANATSTGASAMSGNDLLLLLLLLLLLALYFTSTHQDVGP
jgi:hypothetical protein